MILHGETFSMAETLRHEKHGFKIYPITSMNQYEQHPPSHVSPEVIQQMIWKNTTVSNKE
jgi:hypothetical protein